MAKVSVIYAGNLRDEELLNSLSLNIESIYEVVAPKGANLKDSGLPVKEIEGEFKGGELLNALVSKAEGDYLLLVKPGVSFEEEFIAELLEEAEESSADFTYPNLILKLPEKEVVKNFQQPFEREVSLAATLQIEEWVADYPSLLKRSSLGERPFDPFLKDYEVYDFLYRNLRRLKIYLAEFSYSNYAPPSFVETPWRSFVLRERVLKEFDWERELFPFLSWKEKPSVARATALTLIGKRLSSYYDYFNASSFFKEALLNFHNQESLKELISSLIKMGEFEKALSLADESQGLSSQEVGYLKETVGKFRELLKELEGAVKEGKALQVVSASSDVFSVYQGAPLYNLVGVALWLLGEKEKAYRLFYTALTMNPLNGDYLFNLKEASKELKREEDLENLLTLLLSGEADG